MGMLRNHRVANMSMLKCFDPPHFRAGALGWWLAPLPFVPKFGLKETKMFLLHSRVKVSIVGSLRDREVACSASDRQGSNFESCVWNTSVISIISLSSGGSPGPVQPICAQRWPKARFISFPPHFHQLLLIHSSVISHFIVV